MDNVNWSTSKGVLQMMKPVIARGTTALAMVIVGAMFAENACLGDEPGSPRGELVAVQPETFAVEHVEIVDVKGHEVLVGNVSGKDLINRHQVKIGKVAARILGALGNGEARTVDDIDKALKPLQEKWYALASKIYQANQPQGEPQTEQPNDEQK